MHQIGSRPNDSPVLQHLVLLAKYPAVNRVPNSVAPSGLAEINKRAGKHRLAFGGKGHFHRIVHPAGHHDFQSRSIRPCPQDVSSAVMDRGLSGPLVRLLCKRAFRPIDIAIRTSIRAVDVIGTARQGAAFEPFLALVGQPVSIRIRKFPDTRWRSHIDRAGMPKTPLGKHDVFREDLSLVVHPVVIGVPQAANPMRGILQLLSWRKVGS